MKSAACEIIGTMNFETSSKTIKQFDSIGEMRTANRIYSIIERAKRYLKDNYDDGETYEISNITFLEDEMYIVELSDGENEKCERRFINSYYSDAIRIERPEYDKEKGWEWKATGVVLGLND